MEKDYVMPFNEFAGFLQTYSPNEYIPDGYVLAPIAAQCPLGYTVWLVSDQVVEDMQKGI